MGQQSLDCLQFIYFFDDDLLSENTNVNDFGYNAKVY